jgi:hypothetical protein
VWTSEPPSLIWRILLLPLSLVGIVAGMFDRGRPPIPHRPPPPLGNLRRVVAVGQSQRRNATTITLLSLELYDGGCYLNAIYAPTMERRPMNIEFVLPVIEAHDDVGTRYKWWPDGGDDSRGRFQAVIAPAPPEGATGLRITVTELFRERPRESRSVREAGPWEFVISLAEQQ